MIIIRSPGARVPPKREFVLRPLPTTVKDEAPIETPLFKAVYSFTIVLVAVTVKLPFLPRCAMQNEPKKKRIENRESFTIFMTMELSISRHHNYPALTDDQQNAKI